MATAPPDPPPSVADWAAPNPVKVNRSGLIGKPVERYEGALKVTGAACYAADVAPPSPPAFGYMVPATVAKGCVVAIDTARADATPGVLLVWTHESVPPQGQRVFVADPFADTQFPNPVMPTDEVRFYGETVGFVVADSFETAREAALAIDVTYAVAPAAVEFAARVEEAELSGREARRGDFEQAFAAAAVQVDESWTTPIQNHAQIEPHASLAWWDGDWLTIHNSNQMVRRAQRSIAATLQIAEGDVRLLTRYVGGGFGGKVFTYDDAVLAALAARALGRPVKVSFTRRQMSHGTIHRPATHQRVRLGADRDGRLTALSLVGTAHCARDQVFMEPVALFARSLYAAPNRLMAHRLVKLDLPFAGPMRAPGEASGMLSLECAMDELAERAGVDPVELRLRNEPAAHPESGKPFTVRQLARCLTEGAERFGWRARDPRPGARREGRWRIGMGMACAVRGSMMMPAKAAMAIDAEGVVTVRQGMTDIGTGTYTILAQIAAETLGVALECVRVELGDSDFPPTPGSGGQFGAASAGSAVLAAGMELRRALARLAAADPASPLYRSDSAAAQFADGAIAASNRFEPLAALVARAAPAGVAVVGESRPASDARDFSQQTYGSQFAEVAVDAATGEVRVRRMTGIFAAGLILNRATALSQIKGGMIWGIGAALTEGNEVDPRNGSLLAQDLEGYHLVTGADVGAIDAVLLDEIDEKASPLGIKGVGELGICGAGAAIANAVYNAVGARVRDYPITPDKVLMGMMGQRGAA